METKVKSEQFFEKYAKVKELAKEAGVTQIRLYVDKTNFRAQKVYQKLGMAECHYLMYEEEQV